MNYEKMWKELKAKIEKDLQFYRDGSQCSPIEAPMGVMHCSAVLREMERLENKTCFQDELAKVTDRLAHYVKYEGVHLSSLSLLTELPFKSNESAAYYQGYDGDILKVDDFDNPCAPWVSLLIDNEWEQFASLNNDIIEGLDY